MYFTFLQDEINVHPTALYISVHGDPYISKKHEIIVEKAVLLAEVNAFKKAVCYLFASHYIFNCKYDDSVCHFWGFIQRGVLEIQEKKRMSSKVYNLLQKLK